MIYIIFVILALFVSNIIFVISACKVSSKADRTIDIIRDKNNYPSRKY